MEPEELDKYIGCIFGVYNHVNFLGEGRLWKIYNYPAQYALADYVDGYNLTIYVKFYASAVEDVVTDKISGKILLSA